MKLVRPLDTSFARTFVIALRSNDVSIPQIENIDIDTISFPLRTRGRGGRLKEQEFEEAEREKETNRPVRAGTSGTDSGAPQ